MPKRQAGDDGPARPAQVRGEGARIVQRLAALDCGCRRWPGWRRFSSSTWPCTYSSSGGSAVCSSAAGSRGSPSVTHRRCGAARPARPRCRQRGRPARRVRVPAPAATLGADALCCQAPFEASNTHLRRRRRRPAAGARRSRPSPGVSQQPQPGGQLVGVDVSAPAPGVADQGWREAVARHRPGLHRQDQRVRHALEDAEDEQQAVALVRQLASACASPSVRVDRRSRRARHSASTWPRSTPSRVPRFSATIWFWPALSASP